MLSSYGFIAGGTSIVGDKNLVNVLFQAIGIVVAVYLAIILFTLWMSVVPIVAIFITVFMTLSWVS